jgi:phage repressor protein C with HTH and peptisase S24 domain
MARLLHSILDLLETPKVDKVLRVSGDSAVAMPDPQADKPLTTKPSKKQASVKKLASSAKSPTNKTTKKRSSSKKKVLTRKKSVSANKVATSSGKPVKPRQSTSSTVTKTGTARTSSSSLPTEGDTTISENTPLKEIPVKTRKKSAKTASNRKEGRLLTSS